VLTDLLLDYDGIRVEQVYPAELPDLFAGSQLVVAGRYREGGPATITLRGTTNGREQVFTYPDQRFRDEAGEAFIPRLWATRAIGHLMQQIRLHGEDSELVQSIVNLSTRYGIITPYTSFLIEEDDILNQIGIEGQPIEEPMEEAAAELAAPASVSGAAAVDRAATESEMMAADTELVEVTRIVTEVITEEGLVSQPVVQTIGSKTFFWRNGQWVDSIFDMDSETPQVIPFASDAYFELLSTQPELGQFLALGEQMILVVDGQAFQVTAEGGEQGELETRETGILGTEVVEDNLQSAITDPQLAEESIGLPICNAALILPLLLLAGVEIGGRQRKRKDDYHLRR